MLALNPMTHLIDAFRAVLLDQRMPGIRRSHRHRRRLGRRCSSGAWVMFHRAEFDFAENL